ncbi:hypothetical protein CC85DRAFT_329821 [Cutaneotrichosporon oleaginosum]|uniref:GET complex, subunit GET2 n=1 Tax=Cutaneotrichosporon oleaginosum TaxID=879819 RepID=A0A0J1AYY6_9TREE|nr:uncharacterized protein CC85DRAFT_329821 [Cutaneotrichosporon oleaginosum]KLT40539.1 hypothetical protein CC85DRAFT_329821 [Cutaneotrichosporon oleaginosum]TXT08390.1 hypothetical protein COLE_05314 [Cutaneotrichosporon oleaginosum]
MSQTEAQRRAAARKAKILARGNAGLERLAHTARGDEAAKLYGASAPSASVPSVSTPSAPSAPTASQSPSSTPAPSQAPVSVSASSAPASSVPSAPGPTDKPGWARPTPGRTPTPGTRAAAADPANMDLNALMQMMGQGDGDPFAGQDPFAALMAQMGNMEGMGGGMPPMGMPGMGMPGMGMPGMGMAPPAAPRAQRLLPLIHAAAVVAFTLFVVVWWEPTMQLVRAGGEAGSWAARWRGLGGRAGGFAAKTFGHLPVFYAFATLECMLLALRVVVVRPQARLHPLLANALPILPPAVQRAVVLGSKYLGVVGQTYADACLFVFGLGCAVVVAEYL